MKKACKFAAIMALVLSMCMASFLGCSNNSSASGGTSQTSSTTDASSGATETKTQKVVLAFPVQGPVDNNSMSQQYLSTLVPGLEVEFLPLELSTFFDQLNPIMASNSKPDAVKIHQRGMVDVYQQQGVLSEVTPEQIKKEMPKFYEASKEYGLNVWRVAMVGDKFYGLPQMEVSQTRPFTNCWRKDWLDKVGITKIPETIEEYEAAFDKFVNGDPDGNGQKDTYAFTLRGKDGPGNMASSVFGAYGIFSNMWNIQEDGTVRYGITDPRAKAGLEVLHRWYEKGYLDPEFTAVDNTALINKWSNSKVGMGFDTTYYQIQEGMPFHDNLVALTPTAEIVLGKAPKGPDGDYGYVNWGRLTGVMVFTSAMASEEGKLEKTLQLFEIVGTDSDVFIKAKFGNEGEHWKRNEEGAVINISPYNDMKNNGPLGLNFFYSFINTPAVQDSFASKNLADQYKYAIEGTVKDGEDYLTYLNGFIPGEAATDYKAAAETVYLKNYIDFITGARSLDEYDAFIEEWEKAGGAAYTEVANETYKTVGSQMEAAEKAFS